MSDDGQSAARRGGNDRRHGHDATDMTYRLVAVDLDGTLLTHEKRVSPRTRRALAALTARGCHVVVATGRPFDVLRVFCAGVALTAPQITFNGAVIHDLIAGRDLYRQLVPPAYVRPTIDFFVEAGVPSALYTTDGLYLDRRMPNPADWTPPPLPPAIYLDDMRQAADHPSIKVVGQADPETVTRLRPRAVAAFGRDLYVTQTAANLLEFLHPDVSKGSALRRVAALLGVAREEIIAFGDSHNDLTMFAYAGLAVAMRNATPEVRAGADLVAESNEEDGVAAALERLGLVEG